MSSTNQENIDFFYSLLKDGYSAEDITKMLNDAQKKVTAESEKEEIITIARANVTDAYINYLIAMGIIDENDEEEISESYDEIYESFSNVEDTIKTLNYLTFL